MATVYRGAADSSWGTTPSRTATGQFTLDNLMSISGYSSVFARSLLLALMATVICLVIAFPVGYFLSRLRRQQAAHHADAGHAAHVDELPAAHLRLDGPAGESTAPSTRVLGLFGLGPYHHAEHLRRGGAGHGVQLCALYDPAAVYQHDQDRPEPGGGRAGSGRFHHQDPCRGCSSP